MQMTSSSLKWDTSLYVHLQVLSDDQELSRGFSMMSAMALGFSITKYLPLSRSCLPLHCMFQE